MSQQVSAIAFGGVLILGTMDHKQIQPYNQLPFLISSLVLACFYAIDIQNSVRSNQDIYFQCLQQITRINPSDLIINDVIKDEFLYLQVVFLHFFQIGKTTVMAQIWCILYQE